MVFGKTKARWINLEGGTTWLTVQTVTAPDGTVYEEQTYANRQVDMHSGETRLEPGMLTRVRVLKA
jgi:hypothetical protein